MITFLFNFFNQVFFLLTIDHRKHCKENIRNKRFDKSVYYKVWCLHHTPNAPLPPHPNNPPKEKRKTSLREKQNKRYHTGSAQLKYVIDLVNITVRTASLSFNNHTLSVSTAVPHNNKNHRWSNVPYSAHSHTSPEH